MVFFVQWETGDLPDSRIPTYGLWEPRFRSFGSFCCGGVAMGDDGAIRRALVFEPDALVSERLRYMLRAEQFRVAVVDDAALFWQLAQGHAFELFAVAGHSAEHPAELERLRKLDPLLILVSSAEPALITRLRMSVPGAGLLDRALRDPDAVRRVLGSETLSPSEPAVRFGSGEDVVRAAFGSFALSERQLEVLSYTLRGETSRDIAVRLFISEPTVRNHLHAIYERVGVSGRRELLGHFVRGLIGPGPASGGPDEPPTAASGTRSVRAAGET